MRLSAMRDAIKEAYPSKRFWRIVDEWPDAKVIAVYRNLKDQGKVNK